MKNVSMKKLFPFLGLINTACVVTITSFLCGVTAILCKLTGHWNLFLLFMLIAALLDMADGMVARKLHQCSAAGELLDSLADLSNFAVITALYFCCCGQYQPTWCIAGAIYALCGILRLFWFTATPHSANTFTGVASPWAATLLICITGVLLDILKLPPTGILSVVLPIVCVLLALSMICGFIHIKKVGPFSIFIVTLGIVVTMCGLIISA